MDTLDGRIDMQSLRLRFLRRDTLVRSILPHLLQCKDTGCVRNFSSLGSPLQLRPFEFRPLT